MLRWALLGAVGGIYWVGVQQRPATRQSAVAPLDAPDVARAWLSLTRLPHFRVLWGWTACKAVCGRQHARVLDVGSGAGQLALALAGRPEVRDAVGIDLSGELVQIAREDAERHGAHAEFYQVDAAEMPFPDASFDVVVSTLSLHHWSDPQGVLREIDRVLVPGGKVLIVDLRRDAPALVFGMAAVIQRLGPPALAEVGEPLASFQAAYTPWEVALLGAKAGWGELHIGTGPFWLVLEYEKSGTMSPEDRSEGK